MLPVHGTTRGTPTPPSDVVRDPPIGNPDQTTKLPNVADRLTFGGRWAKVKTTVIQVANPNQVDQDGVLAHWYNRVQSIPIPKLKYFEILICKFIL